jgi:hypothetical protein
VRYEPAPLTKEGFSGPAYRSLVGTWNGCDGIANLVAAHIRS